jgi:hypothetical protein
MWDPLHLTIASKACYGDSISFYFFLLLATLAPGVYSAYIKNEYQKQEKMFLESTALPVRKAGNLTSICEPIKLNSVA